MSSGTTCTVYADGIRVADGAATDDPDDPTALSGLSITWGRSTTVDQPEAATLSMDLMDSPGGDAFADVLATGTAVTVTATGITYPDPTVSTFTDPGFEAGAPHTTNVVGAGVTRSTRRAQAGAASARIRPTGPGATAVVFAPAAFAAPGTHPDAWDAIPATAAGQRWSFGAGVFAPPGAHVEVRAVLFTGPYAAAWTVVPAPVLTLTGDGAWHALSGSIAPTVAGAWVGIQVKVNPTGPSWDQVAGAWDAQPAGWAWDDYGDTYVDQVAVLAPAGGVPSTVLVYAGLVTDLESLYDDQIPAPVVRVTAADFTAALANRDVGDEPWLLEPMATRFNRIIALSGLAVDATIAPTVAAIPVTWRDVDRQPATDLLADLAASVDAVMWPAVHQVSGPYLLVEDQSQRAPSQVLKLVDGVVVIVQSAAGALVLSACDVLRDPVTWKQNVTDVATRVTVSWLDQTLDEDGLPAPTERTLTLVDEARESADGFGARRYGITTQLAAELDAGVVAEAILARTAEGWRAEGLTVDDGLPAASADTAAAEGARMLTLLDGTARNGLPIHLVDLPAWAPVPEAGVYLEGGRYAYEDGRWLLELVVSNSAGSGTSTTWDQLPAAWTWNQFDPAITWDDLRGVGLDGG